MDEPIVDARSLPEHDIDGWVATAGPDQPPLIPPSFFVSPGWTRPCHERQVTHCRQHPPTAWSGGGEHGFPVADSVGRCPVIFPFTEYWSHRRIEASRPRSGHPSWLHAGRHFEKLDHICRRATRARDLRAPGRRMENLSSARAVSRMSAGVAVTGCGGRPTRGPGPGLRCLGPGAGHRPEPIARRA